MDERDMAFVATPIGKAYVHMRVMFGKACQIDSDHNASMPRMKKAWDASNEASEAFRRLLYDLMTRSGDLPASPDPAISQQEEP
jgi:hypothetical protein